MSDARADWVVYLIEQDAGGPLWFFWREEIADWVEDVERATRYVGEDRAATLAECLSDEQGVEAKTIRADEVA